MTPIAEVVLRIEAAVVVGGTSVVGSGEKDGCSIQPYTKKKIKKTPNQSNRLSRSRMEDGEGRSSEQVIIRQGTAGAHHRVRGREEGGNETGDEGLVEEGEERLSSYCLLPQEGSDATRRGDRRDGGNVGH